jgi:hypothetical protein
MDNNVKLVLAQLGMNLAQGVGDAMTARLTPEVYQQQQENRRQAAQLAQQAQFHNSISPYEQAQLDAAHQNHADTLAQQQLENQRQQGESTWNMLRAGATLTPAGLTPDFRIGTQGWSLPKTHSISASSAVGESLGLTEDLDGLSTDEYAKYVLPQLEKLSAAGDKRSQLEANGRALDAQMPSNVALIKQRFAPTYYQQLGQVDPMADSLAANFTARLNDAAATDRKKGDQAATAAVMKELSSFRSPWEEARQASLNRQVEINAHAAANAQTAQDRSFQFSQTELNHLAGPVEQQARELGQLQSTLSQGTPAADALVAPQLIRVIGQMNRSSEPEMARVVGGRSAWQSFQAAAQHWSLDPASANSITPAQRQQMQGLLGVVQQKVQTKLDSLNKGFSDLATSRDVMEHRRILDRTRKSVTDVDAGAGSPAAGSSDPVSDLVRRYR